MPTDAPAPAPTASTIPAPPQASDDDASEAGASGGTAFDPLAIIIPAVVVVLLLAAGAGYAVLSKRHGGTPVSYKETGGASPRKQQSARTALATLQGCAATVERADGADERASHVNIGQNPMRGVE